MKRSTLFFFLLTILLLPGYLAMAQPMRGEWMLGSGGEDNLRNIMLTYPDGTVCHAGLFSGASYHIGPYDLTNTAGESFFIMRFNTDGYNKGMWLQQLTANGSMTLMDVFIDQESRAHIVGTFTGDSIYLRPSMYGRASLVDTVNPDREKLFCLILESNGDITDLTAPIPFDNTCNYTAFHVAWSKEGNMALSGSFFGDSLYTADIVLKNPYNLNSYFLLYFDNRGNALWGINNKVNNSMGEDYMDFFPGGLDISQEGSVTMAGTYESNVNPVFGPVEMPIPSVRNIFLVQYDPSGSFLWGRYGVLENSAPVDILQLEHSTSGDVYLTGNFTEGSITFAPEILYHPDYGPALFLFRFDGSGNTQWSMAYSVTNEGVKGGSAKSDVAGDDTFIARLIRDSQDNIYLTGWYSRDTLSFPDHGDTLLRKPGHTYDQYLAKYTPDGSIAWVQRITANVRETPSALINDSDELFIAATFRDSLIMPEDTLPGGADSAAYVLGFSGDGALTYTNTVRNLAPDNLPPTVDMIQPAQKRSIYLTGSFQGTIGIDNRELSGSYTENIYLAKLSPNTVMEGDVLLHSGDPVSSGFVYLYEVSPPNEPALLEITGIDGAGHYAFYNIDFGDYFLHIKPNSSQYPNAFDTWYKEGTVVEEADTLHFTRDTLVVSPVIVNEMLDTFDILAGTVTDTAGTPVSAGYVLLYRLDLPGMAPVTDSVILDGSGNYAFHDIIVGNYLVCVYADTTVRPGAISTYYGDVAFWEAADTIYVSADTITGTDITLLEIPQQLDGTGLVEGDIYREEPTKSVSSVTGEPVKKIKVILIRKEKSSGGIVAWVYTDDEGHYVFENVPDGSYQIIIDIPGLAQDSTYTVNITVDNNVVSGLDFLVTKDAILMAKASGVSHPAAGLLRLTVWPNPTDGHVTLMLPGTGEGVITLCDGQGRIVYRAVYPDGRKRTEMDLTGLPSGIYYLQVTSHRKTGISRVIIQH